MTKIVSLRIPERGFQTLRDFANLGLDQSNELLAALQDVSIVVSTNALSVDLDDPLPYLTQSQSYEFVSVLFNLWSTAAVHGWDMSDVAETIASYDELQIESAKQDAFSERLYAALQTPAIADTANAADVATEYDAIFHSVRCITDLRPVFTGAESKITGAVLVRNLRIAYSTDTGIETLTVALTDSDLHELLRVLADAQERGVQLYDYAEKSGL